MRCRIFLFLGILAGCAGLFYSGQEKAAEPETGPLLRTDLLNFQRPPLEKSLRNIFIPIRGEERTEPGKILDSPEGISDVSDPGAVSEETGEASPLPRIDLNYIGYVGDENRKVALIIRGGEALAVKRGEILPDGVVIKRISSEEVEVELPGGETVKFFLEGEK